MYQFYSLVLNYPKIIVHSVEFIGGIPMLFLFLNITQFTARIFNSVPQVELVGPNVVIFVRFVYYSVDISFD